MQETKALISAMTVESRGGSRAAAPGCGFSREQPLSSREVKKVRNIILSSGTSTSYFEIAVHGGFSEGAHRLLSHGPLGPSENSM